MIINATGRKFIRIPECDIYLEVEPEVDIHGHVLLYLYNSSIMDKPKYFYKYMFEEIPQEKSFEEAKRRLWLLPLTVN